MVSAQLNLKVVIPKYLKNWIKSSREPVVSFSGLDVSPFAAHFPWNELAPGSSPF